MIYLEDFKNKEDVLREFDVDNLDGYNILFAYYCIDGYEGSAFVLLEHNGLLYEVNGGHCSCNGLEGQWNPQETSIEALLHRLNFGSLGISGYENKFRTVIQNAKLLLFINSSQEQLN